MRALAALVTLAIGCSGKLPPTRYYQLAVETTHAAPARETAPSIALEPLVAEPAYDDERIVYRTSPYRLDYYQYHRWSASPGPLVGNFLEEALERTGTVHVVSAQLADHAPLVLGGRVIAIEEVDVQRDHWLGRIVVELALTEARTGTVLWSQQYEETEPVTTLTPEGLARAVSVATTRIAAKAAPQIAEHAKAAEVATARKP